jgi:tetratricopeptide (TPR) repeat protein
MMEHLPLDEPMTAAKPGATKGIPTSFVALFCALIAALLYINTLGHEFTIDDGTVIGNNRFTKQGIQGIDDIFSEAYRAGFWDRQEGLYRPLSVALFALEWEFFPDNPLPGHLINILLYALSAACLYLVLFRLLSSLHPLVPLTATLIWLVHPLHTEVVANIKSSDELLAFLFGIAGLLILIRYTDQGHKASLVFASLTFALALLAKENSVTWLGVYPLSLWFFRGKSPASLLRTCIPFVLVLIGFFALRLAVLGEIGGGFELMLINNSMVGAKSAGEQLATALLTNGKYLLLFLFPKNLAFDYSYNTIPTVSFSHPGALLSLLICVAACWFVIRTFNRKHPMAFGILFYLGTIALVSNLFMLIEATMAERFTFTPSVGLAIVLAIGFGNLLPKGERSQPLQASSLRQPLFLALVLPALLLLSARTISRNTDWKDNLTLLEHDVKVSPNSARIRYALGSAYLIEKALKEPEGSVAKTNYLDRAIAELSRGVTILPNYNEAWYHLGLAYKEKNNAAEAVRALEQARSYKAFTDAEHLNAIGLAYGMNGQFDKAIADLREACKLSPGDVDVWNNYGLYLSDAGMFTESHAALDTALRIDTRSEKALYNKGNTFAKQSNYTSALIYYRKALDVKPNYTDALNNSGNCHILLNRPDSALVYFKKATEADPGNTKALINIGVTLNTMGDTAQARIYLERAGRANTP